VVVSDFTNPFTVKFKHIKVMVSVTQQFNFCPFNVLMHINIRKSRNPIRIP